MLDLHEKGSLNLFLFVPLHCATLAIRLPLLPVPSHWESEKWQDTSRMNCSGRSLETRKISASLVSSLGKASVGISICAVEMEEVTLRLRRAGKRNGHREAVGIRLIRKPHHRRSNCVILMPNRVQLIQSYCAGSFTS